MERPLLHFTIAVLGGTAICISEDMYLRSITRVENKAVENYGYVYTVIDSTSTTDWNHPKTDTIVAIPLSASKFFRADVTNLINKGRVKVQPRPR